MPITIKRTKQINTKASLWAKLKTLTTPTIKYQTSTLDQIKNAIKQFERKPLPFLKSITTVKALNNQTIDRNSSVLAKYKKIGYTIKGDTLVAPKTSETRNYRYVNEFHEQIQKFNTKNIKYIILNFLNGEPAILPYDKTFSKRFKSILNRISGDELLNYTIVFNSKNKYGPSFDGQINCIIKACLKHCKYNNFKQPEVPEEYQYGVFEEDIQNVANLFKFPIIINANGESQKFNVTKKNKALQLELHSNHAEQITSIDKSAKITIKYIDFTESSLLNYIKSNISLKSITNLIGFNDEISSVSTKDTTYQLRYQNGIDLQDTKCMTANQYYYDKHFEFYSNKPLPISSKNVNIGAIEAIRSLTINISKEFHINSANIIDINSAYNNFGILPTDLSYFYDSSDWDQSSIISIIDKQEGFGLIDRLVIGDIVLNSWQPFCLLRHLIKQYNFVKFKCTQMMLSNGSTEFDIKNFMALGEPDKRRWHKCLGKHIKITKTTSRCTTDPVSAKNMGGIEFDHLPGLYICTKQTDYIGKHFYPHITGYVHGYTNIRIIDEYIKLKKQNYEVLRIWVDGIYFRKQSKQYKLSNGWKYENPSIKIKQEFEASINDYPKVPLIRMTNVYIEPSKSKKIAYVAPPGYGKSYKLKQIYAASPSTTLIVVPTNQLKRSYDKNNLTVMTYQKILANQRINYDWVQTILIDEYTMITPTEYQALILKFPYLTHTYIFGDPAQLPNIHEQLIDLTAFKMIELKTNYRSPCPIFQKQLLKIRTNPSIEFINQKTTIENAIKDGSIILSATHSEIKRINEIGLELNPNDLIDGYKIGAPVVFKKDMIKFDIINNDEGVITDIKDRFLHILVNDKIIEIDIDRASLIADKNHNIRFVEVAYSSTYHQCQGRTITSNVVLNTKNMLKFKRSIRLKMIYVGITRVPDFSQLSILSN